MNTPSCVHTKWLLPIFAVFLAFSLTSPATTLADGPNRPNVLFIAVDDLNTWAMGLSDDSAAVTPNMNRLAKRGVLFSNAHCAAPACNPSRASVMTSVSPSTSGVYINSQDWRECSQLKDLTTLPKLFREHGYEVMGGGKLYHAANLSVAGLEGFLDAEPWHEYFPSKTRQLADEFVPARNSINGSNSFYGGRFDWNALDIEDIEMGDGKVVHWASQQLSRKHDKPLFLGVGIYRPHIPWYTPKKWFDKYPLDGIELPKTLAGDIDDIPAAGQEMSKHQWHQWLVDHGKWPDAVQAYLASVSFADAMVGQLLEALDNGPLAGNTIVVLWSDHGYHLGHKQHWEKRVLWEQATRVPLVIADHRLGTAGQRCDRPVSLLDLYPTLADLCELQSPAHVEGESLKPFLHDPSRPSQRAVVTTQTKGNHAIRSQHWRYIRYADGSQELYDHRSDIGEFHNVADQPENSDVIAELAAHLPNTEAPMDPFREPKKKLSPSNQRVVVSLSRDSRLDVFGLNANGSLNLKSQTEIEGAPGASLFDQTGRHLYVATNQPNTISVLKVKPKGFEQVQNVSVDAKPSYLAIDPSGRYLLASYYKTGQVTVHRIVGEGRLSDKPVQSLSIDPRAHSVTFDVSGKFVFVSHTQTNSITQFRFDGQTGKLELNSPSRLQREDKIGPRHLWFHPNGKFAYGSDESGHSISAYRLDAETGTLTHLQTLSSFPHDFVGKGAPSRVQVHPNGKAAYIANRSEGSIAVFGIDQDTGRMSFLQRAPTESVVRGFNISPDGKFLIAAGQQSGDLVSYRIAGDGQLKAASRLAAGSTPWWISSFPSLSEPNAQTTSVKSRPQTTSPQDRSLMLGQGTMTGEVSDKSVLLQTRLTLGIELDETGDLPGAEGVACFEWSSSNDFVNAKRTQFQPAVADRDYIVRVKVAELRPDATYFYRAIYGKSESEVQAGPIGSFRTLPGANGGRPVKFIVGSCMNYIKFMHGRAGNAGGPLTATEEDKRLGFPAFVSMMELKPDFFVGTGDIVYYDNPFRVATTVEELRRCWHEQFRFPRMIDFFRHVPTYWSKDDHDFRYNDSDNETDRRPLPSTGISLFHQQLPIAAQEADSPKTYRTIRVSRDLQIWLTEGRDYRSANKAPDGPNKSMWGKEQRQWLKSTLMASDAQWKLVISPTPMVGPDDAYKKDNHASLQGFRHEADAFFAWVKQSKIDNLFLMCGDRHWQYHSIHPSGINEFAVGALNDENARMGVPPGADFGTDPDGLIDQPFTSPEPSGGFVQVIAGNTLDVRFFDDQAKQRYRVRFPEKIAE